MESFRAFRIHAGADGIRAGLETLSLSELGEGEVLVAPVYSSVNYKDALAGTGRGRILRRSPLVGGIDLAGRVVASSDPRFKPGDAVLATGCGLSETRDGGYAERVWLPADILVPLPEGLSLEASMVIGTAGFTAGLARYRMEQLGQHPEMGPLLVTGATGGVGSLAIDIFSSGGYAVTALTGKSGQADYLRALGAAEVLDRHGIESGGRPLEKARWGGAVDTVGGEVLAWLTRTVKPWGGIAAIGLAGGAELRTTVMPFILRAVSLLGISSANCPMGMRRAVWDLLAGDWKPRHLDRIHTDTIGLEDLPEQFARMLSGETIGRTLVRIGEC